ncbi:DUF4235 domain-containing protein [Brevibacterium samyangense]|uniref:DUF4235 domain-containing protein n=1 Tax=Brevibacterium samyangense TaxID=366888 RepID=A0ABN2TB87_9MICO
MGPLAWKVLGVGGGAIAAFAARKAIGIVWEKSTHKPVPLNTHDDEVGLGEALAWTVVSGVGIAVAQLVVQRFAVRTVRNKFGEKALPKSLRATPSISNLKK